MHGELEGVVMKKAAIVKAGKEAAVNVQPNQNPRMSNPEKTTEQEKNQKVKKVKKVKKRRDKTKYRHVRVQVALASTYPISGIFTIILIGFLCLYFSIFDFFDLSRPIRGVRLKEARSAEKSDAFLMGLQDADDFWKRVDGANTQLADLQQTDRHACLGLLYRAKHNVFTPQYLSQIQQIEAQLLAYPEYTDFCERGLDTQECLPIQSPLTMFVNGMCRG